MDKNITIEGVVNDGSMLIAKMQFNKIFYFITIGHEAITGPR